MKLRLVDCDFYKAQRFLFFLKQNLFKILSNYFKKS